MSTETATPNLPSKLPSSEPKRSLTVNGTEKSLTRREYERYGKHNTLEPMSEWEFVQGMAALILHGGAANITFDEQALTALYRQSLADLPGDIFLTAVRGILADWTDTFRLPMAGHIRERADPELKRRRAVHLAEQRSQTHRQPRIEDAGPKMSELEYTELMAETRRILSGG